MRGGTSFTMLTDTGPLIAIIDKGDDDHSACMALLQTLPNRPLITTWTCFTEAMYLLGSVGGYRFQEQLWRWRRDGRLVLLDITAEEADRCDALMRQYSDRPMDLADASLVAVAESRHIDRIFTLDNDFYFYKRANGSVLQIVR